MPGKCRPSLRAKTLDNVMRSNLSVTDKECIKAVFDLNDILQRREAEPVRHGRWIEKPFLLGTSNFCSLCDSFYGMPHGKFNYCPNCGAKMRGGADE